MSPLAGRRILVATPAYGGLLTTEYVLSFLESADAAAQEGIQLGIYLLKNESMISRGRNRCAAAALAGGWDSLFFVDSDIRWSWADMLRLISCSRPVVAGAYPAKTLPVTLNFNPQPEHAAAYFPEGRRDYGAFLRYSEEADSDGCVWVPHATTGFMLISCALLTQLKNFVPEYRYPCLSSGVTETHWDFFPTCVRYRDYLSEDYGFCELVTEKLGERIWLQVDTLLSHVGSFVFDPRS